MMQPSERLLQTVVVMLLAVVTNAWAQDPSSSDVPALPDGVAALPEPGSGADIGVVISSDNSAIYKKLIIPEIYALVRTSALSIDAARRLRYAWRLDDEWQRVSSSLAAQNTTIDAEGSIGSTFTLQRGLVFGGGAELGADLSSAALAEKVAWNVQSMWWAQGLLDANFRLQWLKDNRVTRRALGHLTRVYPQLLDNREKSEQLFREQVEFTYPDFLSGLSWLTFRFKGKDEDLVWAASPVSKKVRQLTGSNRADSLITSGVSVDDLLVWSGKVSAVKPRFDKSVVALAPFGAVDIQDSSTTPEPCYGVESESQPGADFSAALGSGVWNAETKRFASAAGWTPTKAIFVPRELWRIELSSKDPYALYGRQVLYVDRYMQLPVYKIVFDRAGRLWKTIIGGFGLAASSDRSFKFPYPSFLVVVDHQAKSEYVLDFPRYRTCRAYPPDIALDSFDPRKLATRVGGAAS